MAWFSLKNHPYARMADQIKRDKQKQEREKDMQEHWPLCLNSAGGNLKDARAAFYAYVLPRPAWQTLMSEHMIRLHIADLTPEGYKRGSAVKGVDDQF